jgi:hypothetical protein
MANDSLDFEKEGQVSVWFSDHPYQDVPDSYFDEDEQGLCAWAKHFKLGVYDHDCLETNGAQRGEIAIDVAVGQCSYSRSYVDKVVHKITKMGAEKVTWVILLFDYEYRPKKTKIYEDEYVKFVGAYPYDSSAENLFEVDES